jgi:hypothetical protein
MKYLKSFISCAIITLMTPTLAFAQEAGYWGYGSMCLARDCAPGKEKPMPFRNSVGPSGPNIQSNIEECTEHVRAYCGGVGYSSPNQPVPMLQYCTSPGSNVANMYNGTSCPAGQTRLGRAVPMY